jgi:hypothetical protein
MPRLLPDRVEFKNQFEQKKNVSWKIRIERPQRVEYLLKNNLRNHENNISLTWSMEN